MLHRNKGIQILFSYRFTRHDRGNIRSWEVYASNESNLICVGQLLIYADDINLLDGIISTRIKHKSSTTGC